MTVSSEPTASARYELAAIEQRVAAWLVDGAILFLIEGAGFFAARGPGVGIGFVIALAYTWFFLTRNNGQTPGKLLMKIRVIKIDGTAISDADAVIRHIGTLINWFGFLGWLWVLIDSDRQGWHDKLARTYVVKTT